MKTLLALILVTLVTPVFAATHTPTPQEVIQLLKQKMSRDHVTYLGHTRDEFFPCGIDFASTNEDVIATFFYPSDDANDSRKDVRGVFKYNLKSKLAALSDKPARFEVLAKNKFIEVSGTRNRKVTRSSRIVIDFKADGTPSYINIGWAEDNGYPIPMYGCVVDSIQE